MNCYGNNLLTNDIVDERLINSNIKRIGDFINTGTHLEWECKICAYRWLSSPRNILNDNAHCPRCSNCIPLTNDIIDEKIKSRPILRLGDFKINNMTKIEWKCKICEHQWMQKPNAVFNGRGCPKCRMSKGEMKVEAFLKTNNIKYEIQKTFDDCSRQLLTNDKKSYMFYDFYLADYNLMIEYHGKQHYEAIKYFGGEVALKYNKERDQFKKDYCISHNINLLEISYLDYKNIETILKTALQL